MKTKVKELRTAAKLTQRQLAEFVGVSSRTIISIETGRYSPSLMLYRRTRPVNAHILQDREETRCYNNKDKKGDRS